MGISKLTRERLEALANAEYCKSNPGAWLLGLKEVNELACLALAAMDGEPVRNPVLAYADIYRDMAKQGFESVPIWSVITDLERNIAPLYRHAQPVPVVSAELLHTAASAIEDLLTTKDRTGACVWFDLPFRLRSAANAQPAPVVPDESYQQLSELYHAQEKRLFKIAQRIKGQAFDKYSHSSSQAIDVLEAAIFGEDDACRAAMLNQAPVKQPSSNGKSELLQRAEKLAEETAALAQRVQWKDLRATVRAEHAEWAQATFGNTGPVGPLKHLSAEALEAAEAPDDLHEWADMQFLLWDAQRRAGITDEQITQAMIDKLAVNKQREWPEPKDGEPRFHIK